jgi:phosphodiesterase/alkaline phosphatase D-like protein
MTGLVLGPIAGGLSHKRANLWGKAGGPGTLYAWLGRSPDLSDALLAGQSLPLTSHTDYAGVAPVSGLSPDTLYYYSLTLEDRPPEPGSGPFPSFTSFPLPGQPRPFSFAFGSCFRPDQQDGGRIFDQVRIRQEMDGLRFLLLIGDQIYADDYHYNRLGYVARTLDDFRVVYHHFWSVSPFRNLFKSLPAFMTLDDHEVDDDWTWTDHTRTQAQIPIWNRLIRWFRRRAHLEWHIPVEAVRNALQAYWEHQAMHGPHFIDPPDIDQQGRYRLTPEDTGSFAYTFNFGAAAFFVLDTRTRRVKSRRAVTMLGEGQWQALENWLLAVKDDYPVKFLVSSASLLFDLWLDIARDRWSGFPEERRRLLSFIAAHGIEGVYLLTGDLHSAHAVSAGLYGPGGSTIPIYEFCSSPFEQSPNWFTSRTYHPLRSLPLKHQAVKFIVPQTNFGVVRVSFSGSGKPEVAFNLYGEDGSHLATS